MCLDIASTLIDAAFVRDRSGRGEEIPGFNLLEFLKLVQHDYDEIDREYYNEGVGP